MEGEQLHTRATLAAGKWIDDVPELPNGPPWPELAADLTLGGKPTSVDECAQMRFYRGEVVDFWREHPGEKAHLAGQAIVMLWWPFLSVDADEATQQGLAEFAQSTVEPAFVLVLYALALIGAFFAPRRYVVARGAAALVQHRSWRWSSRERAAIGSPGTSSSPCSRRSRSSAAGVGSPSAGLRPAENAPS